MNPSTEDRITGKIHEVTGSIKETAGGLTRNPDLEAEGRTESLGGYNPKEDRAD